VGMISPRSRFRGNREWKEGALVGPSLPLIVRAVSRSAAARGKALSQLALIRPAIFRGRGRNGGGRRCAPAM